MFFQNNLLSKVKESLHFFVFLTKDLLDESYFLIPTQNIYQKHHILLLKLQLYHYQLNYHNHLDILYHLNHYFYTYDRFPLQQVHVPNLQFVH
nr:MAG TPA: hypothetical protein [Caudoviricetes sp.]